VKKRWFNFTGTIFQKLFEIEIFEFSKKGANPNVGPGLTFGILRYQEEIRNFGLKMTF